MTAVTRVAARPGLAAEPGIGAVVRGELAKLTAQWPLRVVLALCILGPVVIAAGMHIVTFRPTDTLFGRWAGTTGFATSLFMLNWASAFGAALLASVFAGDIFAGEDRHGTWKTVLTRSCPPMRLFAGKAIAAVVCAWAGFAMFGLVSIAASLAAEGSSPLVGLSGQLIGPGRALGLVAAAWALSLLPATAFAALGLLVSVASRSSIIGVLGPMVAAVILQGLEAADSGQIARMLLLSAPADAWHGLFTEPVHAGPVIQGAVISAVYTTVFAGAAWWLLRRRDIAVASAVPARGRAGIAVRIAAVAAVVAVLGAVGNIGPTALTSGRLDASVAVTYGHLSSVRYLWQTGDTADGTIPWHAVCSRGGTLVNTAAPPASKGAGDDWECIITDMRASDGAAPVTVDVELRANGCYQAASPPEDVGALYVSDNRGTTFINPLYAFDGCLGTP